MEMGTTRKKQILKTVAVSLGCSSGMSIGRKPKLKFLFNLKPKQKKKQENHYNYQKHPSQHSNNTSSFSSYCCYDNEKSSSSTFSPDIDIDGGGRWDLEKTRQVRGMGGRVGGESVAVEKESDDPYLDFRQSMLQMILENQIYSKEDLKDLLDCFLQLNSPFHHQIIVRAFTEIWNAVFSVKPPPPPPPAASSKLHCHQYHHRRRG